MAAERWSEIERLYHEALARPAADRTDFLSQACGGDDALRREVESLLAHERDGAFLSTPATAFGDDPDIRIGQTLGAYVISARLGEGGMGEVYQAHDTTLGRDVAIKVLPSIFASDPDRLARFEREARMLASLNHPHIGAIYGLEKSNGIRALVLELVGGSTLAERLAKGPLSIAEGLPIAKQIAEALEAAHACGIVHRDLKPANIKITPAGVVKVLDFGLAKAVAGDAASGQDLSQLPIAVGASHEGLILGTPAYMSPEQARGQAVDKRTDIWAFGCVLHELLTGRPVFRGKTISDTIALILEREPQWGLLPAHTPAGIRRLLGRCLDKDPNRRLHDIADARIEIDDVQSGTVQDGYVAQAPTGSRRRLPWALTLALTTLTAAAIGMWARPPALTAPEAWTEINTPPTSDASLAVSPDGLKVVFVGRSAGPSQLWLRALDSPLARPLIGTERGSSPFWSPDSRSIGFYADEKLKRMDIAGGSIETLTPTQVFLGGAWNGDGTIIFSNNVIGPIVRISAKGGEPAAATRIESRQQRGHSFPQFLPDGRHFLFFVNGSPEVHGVYIGQLDRMDTKRLFDADAAAAYTATRHLLFIREGRLLAQGFDPDRLELRGDPFPIAEHVTGETTVSTSAAGPVAYRTPSADSGQRQFVWADRSGREIDKVAYSDASNLGPSLSEDGRRVAVYRLLNGNMDIWAYETGRRAWDRITFDSGDDIFPLWSPDGTSIVFASNRKRDVVDLYRERLSAPQGSEELLLSTSQHKFPMSWSADGRFLLYDSFDQKQGSDIWALPLEGDRKPFPVVQTNSNERAAQFSPDGRWIAYQSDKTGRYEIYVRPFPGPGGDSRVSIDGGAQVRWNPNGQELFYVATDDRLMAVPIHIGSLGKSVELGTPLGLFATNVGSTARLNFRQQYMVSRDGQSFVMNSVVGGGTTSPITVILNWKPNR